MPNSKSQALPVFRILLKLVFFFILIQYLIILSTRQVINNINSDNNQLIRYEAVRYSDGCYNLVPDNNLLHCIQYYYSLSVLYQNYDL